MHLYLFNMNNFVCGLCLAYILHNYNFLHTYLSNIFKAFEVKSAESEAYLRLISCTCWPFIRLSFGTNHADICCVSHLSRMHYWSIWYFFKIYPMYMYVRFLGGTSEPYLMYWHQRSAFQRLAFGRSTAGNDIVPPPLFAGVAGCKRVPPSPLSWYLD